MTTRLEATKHLWFLDFPRFLCSSSRVPGCSDLFQLGDIILLLHLDTCSHDLWI